MEFNFKAYLQGLPNCRLIPLGKREKYKKTGRYWINPKRPINDDWRNDTYTLEAVRLIPNKTGIGIVQGEKGNGILCLDFDGANSQQNFKDYLGIGLEDLPPTIAWKSGRPDRHQRAFVVPKSEWSRIDSHMTIPEVEIKWTGQSVIAGFHQIDPDDEGRFYQWLKGCAPCYLPIAEAPEMLIAAIEKYGADKNTSTYFKRTHEELIYDSSRVKKYLSEYLQPANDFSKYSVWLKVGMALHHLSQEHGKEWKHYPDWLEWCSWMDNFDDSECEDKWVSFGKNNSPVTFATIVGLAKKHKNFEPSTPPEEVKKATVEQAPKTPKSLSENATSAVEIIQKGLEEISTLARAADRTAAFELLQKESGLGTKGVLKIINDLNTESNTDNQKYSTFEDVMNATDLQSEPLVKRFIAKGNVVILAADGDTGKSTMCYEIIEAVTTGNKLFGQFETSIGNVKLLQSDESPTDARIKWKLMDFKPNNKNLSLKWDFNPSMIPDLEKEIERDKTDLCVMDSLAKIFGEGNDFNTPVVSYYIYQLNQIASRTQCTFLIVHHLKKDQNQEKKKKKDDSEVFRTQVTKDDLYGSAYILNGASDVWGLWVAGKEFGEKVFRLKNLKNRSMTAPSNHLYQLTGDEESLRYTLKFKTDGDIDDAESVEKAILIFLEQNIDKKFSKEELSKHIPKIRGKLHGKAYIGQRLRTLFNNRSTTGIERCMSSEVTGGRKSYLYYKR